MDRSSSIRTRLSVFNRSGKISAQWPTGLGMTEDSGSCPSWTIEIEWNTWFKSNDSSSRRACIISVLCWHSVHWLAYCASMLKTITVVSSIICHMFYLRLKWLRLKQGLQVLQDTCFFTGCFPKQRFRWAKENIMITNSKKRSEALMNRNAIKPLFWVTSGNRDHCT